MSSGSNQFHLVCAAAHSGDRPQVLAVPSAPVSLLYDSEPGLRLGAAQPRAVVLEAVESWRHPRLLVSCPAGVHLRINGLVASRFCLVQNRDCLAIGGRELHVALFHKPLIQAVPPELAGRECPVCRVPLSAGAMCYQCSCGAAMHSEPDGVPDGLQCAQLQLRSGCPACQKPIILKEGYQFQPEVADE